MGAKAQSAKHSDGHFLVDRIVFGHQDADGGTLRPGASAALRSAVEFPGSAGACGWPFRFFDQTAVSVLRSCDCPDRFAQTCLNRLPVAPDTPSWPAEVSKTIRTPRIAGSALIARASAMPSIPGI